MGNTWHGGAHPEAGFLQPMNVQPVISPLSPQSQLHVKETNILLILKDIEVK